MMKYDAAYLNKVFDVEGYRRLAEGGDPDAQYVLGMYCERGAGIGQGFADAVAWFQKAAGQKHPLAMYCMAQCYETGRGVEKNLIKAVDLYLEVSDSDSEVSDLASSKIAGYYGDGVLNRWLTEKIESGDKLAPVALDKLGDSYMYGLGVKKDWDKAAALYRQAAEAGNAAARCSLGYCYEKGQGVEKDAKLAAYWYEKGAEGGDSAAQVYIGN